MRDGGKGVGHIGQIGRIGRHAKSGGKPPHSQRPGQMPFCRFGNRRDSRFGNLRYWSTIAAGRGLPALPTILGIRIKIGIKIKIKIRIKIEIGIRIGRGGKGGAGDRSGTRIRNRRDR